MKGKQKLFVIIGCSLLLWAGFWLMAAPMKTQGKGENSASNSLAAATKASPTAKPASGKEGMLASIKKLQKDKKLGSDAENGTFYELEDFERSEARLQYIFWYTTDYAPKNFILRADVEWESASTTANWKDSGFGIVFHESEDQIFFYLVQVLLDGNIKVWRMNLLAENYLGKRWFYWQKSITENQKLLKDKLI
jgi:hypothetical protein